MTNFETLYLKVFHSREGSSPAVSSSDLILKKNEMNQNPNQEELINKRSPLGYICWLQHAHLKNSQDTNLLSTYFIH